MRRTLLCVILTAVCQAAHAGQDYKTWKDYGGGPDSSHFVDLKQINKSNVNQLEVAWIYPTGDQRSYVFNPIVVDNVMYVQARNSSLVALDAATGKEIWIHENLPGLATRGIAYWESKDRKDRRLIFAINNYLQEIDARTGKSILTFGNNGLVDLRAGPRPRSQDDCPRSARVAGTRLREPDSAGIVDRRSLSVGARRYSRLRRQNGQDGVDLPHHSASRRRRLRHVAEGRVEVCGRHQHVGRNHGRREARHRVLPHRLAHLRLLRRRSHRQQPVRQLPAGAGRPHRKAAVAFSDGSPRFVGLRQQCRAAVDHGSSRRQARSTPSRKRPNRDSSSCSIASPGKPLWPIEERPVPKSNMPGEQAWPTQPYPTVPPPFARQTMTADDVNPYILTAEERAAWKDRISKMRNEGLFTPPGLEETVSLPGARGGSNWGTSAANPAKGLVYLTTQDWPTIYKLEPRRSARRAPCGTSRGSRPGHGRFTRDDASRVMGRLAPAPPVDRPRSPAAIVSSSKRSARSLSAEEATCPHSPISMPRRSPPSMRFSTPRLQAACRADSGLKCERDRRAGRGVWRRARRPGHSGGRTSTEPARRPSVSGWS